MEVAEIKIGSDKKKLKHINQEDRVMNVNDGLMTSLFSLNLNKEWK